MSLSAADGRQWLRLRQLRVTRARTALSQAQQQERDALAAIARREACIADSRGRLAALAQHWGGAGCADMPRWGRQLQAHRDAVAERLERDEYALLDEQETLAQARTAVAQRRAELARAEARESAVDATLVAQRRDQLRAREQIAELETEDACRPLH